MGADCGWFRNPLPPTDPNYTNNWMSSDVPSLGGFCYDAYDAIWCGMAG
jgi:hypothetical protein